MKNFLVTAPIFLALMGVALADAATFSPSFSKGECSIAYLKTGEKSSTYKVVKKDSLAGLKQKLPTSAAGEVCSKELQADLKMETTNCQVFCNPN